MHVASTLALLVLAAATAHADHPAYGAADDYDGGARPTAYGPPRKPAYDDMYGDVDMYDAMRPKYRPDYDDGYAGGADDYDDGYGGRGRARDVRNLPHYAPKHPGYGQEPGYGDEHPGYGGQHPGYGGQHPGYGGQHPGYGSRSRSSMGGYGGRSRSRSMSSKGDYGNPAGGDHYGDEYGRSGRGRRRRSYSRSSSRSSSSSSSGSSRSRSRSRGHKGYGRRRKGRKGACKPRRRKIKAVTCNCDADKAYGGASAPAPATPPPQSGEACTTNGQMRCAGTGFDTCDNGRWVTRACAVGTACRPDAAVMIVCDWPQNAGAPKA